MTENSLNPLAVMSSFYLEARRDRRGITLLVGKIIGISEFSSELIVLKTHGGRIKLFGKRMKLSIYENSTVEISGRIEEIGFLYGKN